MLRPTRPTRRLPSASPFAAAAAVLAASLCGGCGGDLIPPESRGPFVAQFPDEGPGHRPPPTPAVPPPQPTVAPVFDADAVPLDRTALFGSFPSDVYRYGSTVFTTDADAVEGDGALVVPIDASGGAPGPSTAFRTVRVRASDLVDSLGNPGDASNPIGFGFYLNDVLVVRDDLGFVLANAAGSDSVPTCSNLVAFDPTAGTVLQVVDLANPFPGIAPYLDSTGAPIPPGGFLQAGSEGVEYVPTSSTGGLLYVAMSNFVFGGPSFGAVKYPGTVQVFDVDALAATPVSPRPSPMFATQTLVTAHYNPVALTRLPGPLGVERLLVTVAGTTGYDAAFNLVPASASSVDVFDGKTTGYLGTFPVGHAGLSATRPAVGRDEAGHLVGFFPSSVTGEVYLLRLDGLTSDPVDAPRVAVLRGVGNGIPIDPAAAGGPGGNVTGVGLSPNGRTLVVAGFGNLFAFPAPAPGRLLALSLPDDLVTGSQFGTAYLPGTTSLVTVPGRTLGALVLAERPGAGPDVFVAVGGTVDLSTFLGSGPASIGTLSTFGLIR
jgi:hypothetical protein